MVDITIKEGDTLRLFWNDRLYTFSMHKGELVMEEVTNGMLS